MVCALRSGTFQSTFDPATGVFGGFLQRRCWITFLRPRKFEAAPHPSLCRGSCGCVGCGDQCLGRVFFIFMHTPESSKFRVPPPSPATSSRMGCPCNANRNAAAGAARAAPAVVARAPVVPRSVSPGQRIQQIQLQQQRQVQIIQPPIASARHSTPPRAVAPAAPRVVQVQRPAQAQRPAAAVAVSAVQSQAPVQPSAAPAPVVVVEAAVPVVPAPAAAVAARPRVAPAPAPVIARGRGNVVLPTRISAAARTAHAPAASAAAGGRASSIGASWTRRARSGAFH